jgi:uncharacterized protein (TIGR02001 family)
MALRTMGGALLSSAIWIALCSAAISQEGAGSKDDDQLGGEIKAFLTSDYVYRGVSLSQRKPSGAAFAEATWHGFYANANVQSVALPTNPVGEITLQSGYRWEPKDFTLDLNASYFWYPGETLLEGMPATSYWEYAVNVEREFSQLTHPITLKGLLAYSPNLSGTGAWGAYSEAGLEIKLGEVVNDVAAKLHGSAGYWRFGNTSEMLGGFPLPAYTNWQVGLEFTFKEHFVLDLSYVDTNLSKEDCFVST